VGKARTAARPCEQQLPDRHALKRSAASRRPSVSSADDWPALVEEFTTATRAEPGTLWFDWYRTMTRIPALLAGNSEIVNVDS
jgi:quinol monooxygenase YgiN